MPNILLSFYRLCTDSSQGFEKVPGHSVSLTVLKIYSVFRTFRNLFPGKISFDACLSRIPVETAMCLTTVMYPPGDHMEQERLADWLYYGWATLNASKILLSDWVRPTSVTSSPEEEPQKIYSYFRRLAILFLDHTFRVLGIAIILQDPKF